MKKRNLVSKGAESTVSFITFFGIPCVRKDRIEKNYRNKLLDTKLRTERTRQETRLLHKAKKAGVTAPIVLFVEDASITMTRMKGTRPSMKTPSQCRDAGIILAKLHGAQIIHGDYTRANLLISRKKISVIDFGLGCFSRDLEDQAIDVVTMLDSLENKNQCSWFLEGYKTDNNSYESIMKRIEAIKKRARYA